MIWRMKYIINLKYKGATMKKTEYQIISCKKIKELAKFLAKEGQLLLPMLEFIEQAHARIY